MYTCNVHVYHEYSNHTSFVHVHIYNVCSVIDTSSLELGALCFFPLIIIWGPACRGRNELNSSDAGAAAHIFKIIIKQMAGNKQRPHTMDIGKNGVE